VSDDLQNDDWGDEERPVRAKEPDGGELRLDIDGYEGPIDILLTLARDQKVDLARISILQLADQYLDFIARARELRLELAADYLVMAAWLAYLKSRILLPDPPADDEPTGEELAARLAFQLQRLEAMQRMGGELMARPQLGRDFFVRGMPEGIAFDSRSIFEATLYDLLRAYSDHQIRSKETIFTIPVTELYSVDQALERLERMVGKLPDWTVLSALLPPKLRSGIVKRSAVAAMFVASLELAKQGSIELMQETAYGPLFVRRGRSPKE